MSKKENAEKEKAEKQEKIEKECLAKLDEKKALVASLEKSKASVYDIFLAISEKPPIKSENSSTKEAYLDLVNKQLSQFKLEPALDEFITKLEPEQATLTLEIILKDLELVAQGKKNGNPISGTLGMKLYNKIIEKKGVSIQLRAICRKHAL